MGQPDESAILAAGCSASLRPLLRQQPGVVAARSGFARSTDQRLRAHAEAVEVIFAPDTISFRQLLEFFFQIHDPTTPGRQGDDVGDCYRSAIFYRGEAQRQIALQTIAEIDSSGVWPGPLITEVAPIALFWICQAEPEEFQEPALDRRACHFIRPNWRLPAPGRPEPPTARP